MPYEPASRRIARRNRTHAKRSDRLDPLIYSRLLTSCARLGKACKLATSATESLPSSVQCWYQRVPFLKRPVLESIFWVYTSSTECRSCLAMRSNTLIVIFHHSRHWSPWTEMARRCLVAFDSRQTNESCELWVCEPRSAISATKRAYRVVPDGRGR